MTRTELIESLVFSFDEDEVIVISDEKGGWDNIQEVTRVDGFAAIVFGGGSPFSDE